MKKRIIVLKKGIDKNIGPEAFCCGGGFIAWIG
jgi:hypothetical protein